MRPVVPSVVLHRRLGLPHGLGQFKERLPEPETHDAINGDPVIANAHR
jgi:hypothetical protein